METPSSIGMGTRSQASVASQKSKPRTNERSALLDITNDSPIIGLATTPSSLAAKNRGAVKNTPGSGEALLRGQVKTLLQKVEEEAEFVNNKISSGDRPPFRVLLDLPGPSPVQILAPTPANTPQVPSLSAITSVAAEEIAVKNEPIQIAEAVKPEETTQECLINRALLFDSPEKSELTDSSAISSSSVRSLTAKSPEEDSSSAWSMQVNVSTHDEEDGEVIQDFDEEEEDQEEEEEYYEDEAFEELCNGLSKMSVQEKAAGKHTRFVYNSDGEMEGEEVIGEKKEVSPSVVVLRGVPVPEGKHLRFHDDEEE